MVRRMAALAALVLMASIVAGIWWYEQLPKPVRLTIDVKPPGRTPIEDPNGKPEPVWVRFSASAAPLAGVGKDVKNGITLSPPFEGVWRWDTDQTLTFTPKSDWPVDAEFTVNLAKKGFVAEQILLRQYSFTFRTAPFVAQLVGTQFYQDPVDSASKKVVATVNFSHPVDIADFIRHVVLREEGKSGGFLGFGAENTKFTVSYDKLKLNAYIHSEALPIPAKPIQMNLTIEPGIHAARGGRPTDMPLKQTVTVPGLYSLNVQSAELTHADNDRLEPERLIVINVSADTHEREIAPKLRAWALPVYHPDSKPEERKQPFFWSDPATIGPEILQRSDALKLTPVPAEREYVTQHVFKLSTDAGRYIYVRVDKGFKSFGGYVLEKEYDCIVHAEAFPRQLRIASQGSLLALSGEKKVSVLARDVEGVRYEIGRLMPQQLQHLVTMSDGTFAKPEFFFGMNENNLTERFTRVEEMPPGPPGRPHYLTLDLARYLEPEGGPRRGIFFVRVESYDAKTKKTTGAADHRLIVVTDLGILAKRAIDGSQDVFVQSIVSGRPVAGAAVDVIAKNGATIIARTTDADGHARVPDLTGFDREREPVVYVARYGGDSSFLPFNRYDRRLDYSRFDIGGMPSSADAGRLSAYLFSDRRIYRPGEEIRVGMIVKTTDWSRPLAGLPLEVEIYDARGLVLRSDKIKLSTEGFEEFTYTTLDTAPTGDYTVALYIVKDGQRQGQIGNVTVKVKEFMPDRLKMNVRFSKDSSEGWLSPQDLKARIHLENLSGTPAENRRVTAAMTLAPVFPSFPAWHDYQFYDPQYAEHQYEEPLADAKTNEKGDAEFNLDLGRFERATYRVHVGTEGFEADGGRGVSAETSALVSDMPYLVGYKPDGNLRYIARGSARSVELIAIDPNAKSTAIKDLRLLHFEQRFVSVLTRENDGTYRYESREKAIPLDDLPFELPDRGRRLPLATGMPGSFSYVVRDSQGRDLAKIEYRVAGRANLTRSLEKNSELLIALNKKEFNPGEEIELSIQAPYAGAGLITIEREKVHAHSWFKTNTTSSTQRIRVPADFDGNGYVTVAFIRDPGSEEIYTSPLAYGVEPFSVNLGRRTLKTSVVAPDLVKPGDRIRFRCETDRPARIVVFAVDEGILQVARYRTPDPLGFFFQKRQLEVSTLQILDLILPEFARFMAAAPGGDSEAPLAKYLNPFKRKRDKPVVYWSGIMDSGPKGCEATWQVPDTFNGTLRVMAVAVSADAIGVFEKKIVSRGDFVLSPNAPQTVTPGDEFEVSVGVGNNVTGSGASADIDVTIIPSPHFEVIGDSSVRIKVAESHEGVTRFRVRARDELGSGSLGFTATRADRRANIAVDVAVRPAQPYFVELSAGTVRNGSAEAPITRDLYPEHRTLQAGISAMPLGLAHGLVSYLDNFPYSCTEQLLSMAVPALILADRPEFGIVKSRENRSLDELITVLRARQNGDGAFGLWAANAHVVDYVSVYAMQFLVEARERGRAIPPDMLTSGNNWLKSFAATEGTTLDDERARAFAIYVLTRQGIVTSNFAAALQKRLDTNYAKTYTQDIAAGYLAASYQLMKQQALADSLMDGLQFGAAASPGVYDDSMSRDAVLLFLMARHFPARLTRLKPDALDSLVKAIANGGYNTYSSAQTILALSVYAQAVEKRPPGSFSATERLRNSQSRSLKLPPVLMPRTSFTAEAVKIEFTNTSLFNAYWFVEQSGFDRTLPDKEIKNGLEVLREYVDASGKPLTAVKIGDEVQVRLKFRAIGRPEIENVALVDLLPGGFDIIDNSKPTGWRPDAFDIRDDRVIAYGRVRNEFQEFVYRIKATNTGTFTVPPAYGESMYEPNVRGRSLGMKIKVEGR
jgi:uncharacterized protein YfaS (alpha-2-macroglobulin family)